MLAALAFRKAIEVGLGRTIGGTGDRVPGPFRAVRSRSVVFVVRRSILLFDFVRQKVAGMAQPALRKRAFTDTIEDDSDK
jgi:hypothetical protein